MKEDDDVHVHVQKRWVKIAIKMDKVSRQEGEKSRTRNNRREIMKRMKCSTKLFSSSSELNTFFLLAKSSFVYISLLRYICMWVCMDGWMAECTQSYIKKYVYKFFREYNKQNNINKNAVDKETRYVTYVPSPVANNVNEGIFFGSSSGVSSTQLLPFPSQVLNQMAIFFSQCPRNKGYVYTRETTKTNGPTGKKFVVQKSTHTCTKIPSQSQ